MIEPATQVAVICGGVGAARFLRGLIRVVDQSQITGIVNTGDDMRLHGLAISPDLDTCTYTLAEAINPETGWGLVGETWNARDTLERYGGQTWFGLGDRDLGTHLYRTQRLDEGATLTEVTTEIVRAWDLHLDLMPMSDDPVRTRVVTDQGETLDFQRYFVERQHRDHITSVHFDGVETARPGPRVLSAIEEAHVVVIAPSNPFVSIAPVLEVDGVRAAIAGRREATVCISPIIGGTAIKGPAADLMRTLGHEVSSLGIARIVEELAAHLVIDTVDAELADAIAETGVNPIVADSVMRTPEVAADLARIALQAAT
ncbi:MAG: 2-phospho-L-lactate transferase [Actinomycetota bacterium]